MPPSFRQFAGNSQPDEGYENVTGFTVDTIAEAGGTAIDHVIDHLIAGGHCDPAEPAGDRRLLSVREIGPWTVQCLGLFGRGDPDSLPAGDLMYLKLVGRLARLGRRATIEEVEEFYAPYAPFRGLAAAWTTGF